MSFAEPMKRKDCGYGSYDASWHTPGVYFDKITAVNTSDLTPCTEIPCCPTKKPYKIMRKLLETTMAWKR